MQQTLELSIRATIDQILGKEKVKNELQEITRIDAGATPPSIRQDPLYQELAQTLSPQQLQNAQRSVNTPYNLLTQDLTKKGNELLEDIMLEYEYGTPRYDTRVAHSKKVRRFLTGAARQFDQLENELEGDIGGAGTEAEKVLRKAELENSKQESKQLLDDLTKIFEKYFNPNSPTSPHNINNPHNPNNPANPNGLVQQMMAVMGTIGVGNIANKHLQQYLTDYRGKLVEAQIGAGWQTAFSFDAMGSYTAGERQRFSEYAQRRRYATDKEVSRIETGTAWTAGLGGLGAGMIAGTLFSPVVGTAIGGLVGYGISLLGQKKTGEIKTDTETELAKKQGEMEGQLKMVNDLVAAMAPHVQNYRNWDIMSMRQRARQGGIATPNQIGYLLREEEIQEELGFSEAAGYYDPKDFRRAYTYARSQGLQGSQIYQTQRYRFMLGSSGDGNIAELDNFRRVTEGMYGTGVDPKKQLEVLESIRNIQLDMLKLNIKADTERAKGYGDLPRLIFGDASPYGRINELGGTTLDMLKSMTTPKTVAHDAFMYQMMGAPDLITYEEFKRGGMINNPELAARFFTNTHNLFAGGTLDRYGRTSVLANLAEKNLVPQGMIPYLEEFFTTGKATVDRQRYRQQANGEYIADSNGEFVRGTLQGDGTVKYTDENGKDIYEKYSEQHKTATVTMDGFINGLKKGNSAAEMFGVKMDESAAKQSELSRQIETAANKFVAASTSIAKNLDEQSKSIGGTASGIHASLTSLSNSFTMVAAGLPGLMTQMKNAMDLSVGYYLKNMVDKGELSATNEKEWKALLAKFISDPERLESVYNTIKPENLKVKKAEPSHTYKISTDPKDQEKLEELKKQQKNSGYPWLNGNTNKKDNKETNKETKKTDAKKGGRFGGFIHPHTPYLIGEEGAEIFIPDTAGTIVNNKQLMQASHDSANDFRDLIRELQDIKYLVTELLRKNKEPDPISITVINKLPEDHFGERNRDS